MAEERDRSALLIFLAVEGAPECDCEGALTWGHSLELPLEGLQLEVCKCMTNFDAFSSLSTLRVAGLVYSPVSNLEWLSAIASLTELSLQGCEQVGDFDSLVAAPKLRRLPLHGTTVSRLDRVVALPLLEDLDLDRSAELNDASALSCAPGNVVPYLPLSSERGNGCIDCSDPSYGPMSESTQ